MGLARRITSISGRAWRLSTRPWGQLLNSVNLTSSWPISTARIPPAGLPADCYGSGLASVPAGPRRSSPATPGPGRSHSQPARTPAARARSTGVAAAGSR